MAYTHGQYEVILAKSQSLASAADIGVWAPGLVPHRIKAVALVFTVAAQASGTTKLDKRPTPGSDTARGDGDVADIDYTTTTGAAGLVVYQTMDVEILPGEEVVAQVTDATPTSGTAHVILYVEPRPEVPGNNTEMTLNEA